ncbi:MAG: DUF4252 domain-containing protein [Bacteroidales bacterium]|nr:DUF4252 domain-containing protein [Bacteroidales bacterium]
MKKMILMFVILAAAGAVYGQKSIDLLFDKYANRDGFTTVTLNGSMLKFAACFDDDKDAGKVADKLTEMRILVQEDKAMQVENFYDVIMKDFDLKGYEEVMRVRESNQDLRMLVRTQDDRIREFLMIGGGDDNMVIQIKGNMSLDEAKQLSSDVSKSH